MLSRSNRMFKRVLPSGITVKSSVGWVAQQRDDFGDVIHDVSFSSEFAFVEVRGASFARPASWAWHVR